jgi:serine/threonine-protein kinase
MVRVYVPGGTFQMGSSEAEIDAAFEQCEQDRGSGECSRSWFEIESPPHIVTMDSFWIDRTEVTSAQYRECVEAGACDAPTSCDFGEPTFDDASKADHPVVCVDWDGANAYCEWAGARLPTEAEWEYAARGSQGNTYPWGNTFDGELLNFCDINCTTNWKDTDWDDGYEMTAPVGSFEAGASWFEALDMAGNVWEWIDDWYDGYPGTTYQSDDFGTQYKVLRGGAWRDYAFIVRSAFRYKGTPVSTYYDLGFRCVTAATPSP